MEKRNAEEVSLKKILVAFVLGLFWILLVLLLSIVFIYPISHYIDIDIRWILFPTALMRCVHYLVSHRSRAGWLYIVSFLAGFGYSYLMTWLLFKGFLADSPWSA